MKTLLGNAMFDAGRSGRPKRMPPAAAWIAVFCVSAAFGGGCAGKSRNRYFEAFGRI